MSTKNLDLSIPENRELRDKIYAQNRTIKVGDFVRCNDFQSDADFKEVIGIDVTYITTATGCYIKGDNFLEVRTN